MCYFQKQDHFSRRTPTKKAGDTSVYPRSSSNQWSSARSVHTHVAMITSKGLRLCDYCADWFGFDRCQSMRCSSSPCLSLETAHLKTHISHISNWGLEFGRLDCLQAREDVTKRCFYEEIIWSHVFRAWCIPGTRSGYLSLYSIHFKHSIFKSVFFEYLNVMEVHLVPI